MLTGSLFYYICHLINNITMELLKLLHAAWYYQALAAYFIIVFAVVLYIGCREIYQQEFKQSSKRRIIILLSRPRIGNSYGPKFFHLFKSH